MFVVRVGPAHTISLNQWSTLEVRKHLLSVLTLYMFTLTVEYVAKKFVRIALIGQKDAPQQ